MSNNLEKYLQGHREELDVELPDDQVIWEGVRKDLQEAEQNFDRKSLWKKVWNIAAVVIIVLSIGYIMKDIISERKLKDSFGLAQIDMNLWEREKEYMSLVSSKLEEVESLNHIDNIIVAELFEEVQKLDLIYEQTLVDLAELGNNDKVINTIFDTYEKKIYLLELIILENNKIRNHEEDEKIFL